MVMISQFTYPPASGNFTLSIRDEPLPFFPEELYMSVEPIVDALNTVSKLHAEASSLTRKIAVETTNRMESEKFMVKAEQELKKLTVELSNIQDKLAVALNALDSIRFGQNNGEQDK